MNYRNSGSDSSQIKQIVEEKLKLEIILGVGNLSPYTRSSLQSQLDNINSLLELNKISKERMD